MENQLVVRKQTPAFIVKAMETLEGVKEYAQQILDSKLAPTHFYEKKKVADKMVVDYEKGNVAAVVLVLQHGLEVGLSVSQSLQHIIPVNNAISIKGDGAKSLIMSSGLCESWEEIDEGSLKDGTYTCTITSKRKDTGEEMTRTFSVAKAKRAGLWIDENVVKQKYQLKYSPWWKYPDRMIRYRALGYMCRDLYPDVMSGLVTKEEAEDYDKATEPVTIKDKKGNVIQLKDEVGKPLAEKLAEKVEKERTIKETFSSDETKEDIKVYPVAEEEATPEILEDKPETPKITLPENIDIKTYNYSETELSFLGTGKEIYEILAAKGIDPDKTEGKNTNKKLRNLILQKQAETIEKKVNKNNENIEEAEEVEKEETPSEPELLEVKTNKLGITVFELPKEGRRDFETQVLPMFNEFQKKGLTPEVVNAKIQVTGLKEKYNDIEELLKTATASEINLVINQD